MIAPLFSIVTICYNSEKTIARTIESVINQSMTDYEYIIIDGKSSDNTLSIVKGYSDKLGDRLKIVSEADSGISDAFNKGILHSSGKLITMLNSDDILFPDALKIIADKYAEDIDVYRGNVILINHRTGYEIRQMPSKYFGKLAFGGGTAHQGCFISRSAYVKYGLYRTDLKRSFMDLELLGRFYDKGAKILYINSDIAKFSLGGITSSPLYKKKNDYMILFETKGCGRFQKELLWFVVLLKEFLKKVLNVIGGEDLKRKLHYGSVFKIFSKR